MSISLEEFRQCVSRLVSSGAVQHCQCHNEREYHLSLLRGEVFIRLCPLAPRCLGSLVLPNQLVLFRLVDVSTADQENWWQAFARCFQRGGG